MPSGDITSGVREQDKLLESLLQKLIQKDTLGVPQPCSKNDNIKTHIEKIEQYFKACGISNEESKITILLNSLTDEMRFELCCMIEFKDNEDSYPWIKEKLLELFHPKESEITPLIRLYGCKQKSDQSLREYLSEIRVEGYKLLRNMNPQDREKHLIDAFKRGLRSEQLQFALNSVRVETLDEAYRLVKKEKRTNDDVFIRKVGLGHEQPTCSDIEKLQNQMSVLQKQLTYIVRILEGQQKPTYAEKARVPVGRAENRVSNIANRREIPQNIYNQRNTPYRRQEIQCYRCEGWGHIARFCPKMNCRTCGQSGHIARYCTQKIRSRQFRRMCIDDDEQWENDSMSIQDNSSESSVENQELPEKEEPLDTTVRALTIQRDSNKQRQCQKGRSNKRIKEPRTMKKQYPEDIEDLCDYVEGRKSWRSVRFNKAETLISQSHSEKGRNKPLVHGKCEGRKEKLFLDTGADISVIDYDYVEKLVGVDKITRNSNKFIKCANNSRMNIEGSVELRIDVAGKEKICKFWAVKQLFPKIIIGIRALKDLGMSMDLAQQCVWIQGVRVPFLSSIQSQSVCNRNSGNGKEPGLRVAIRQ